MSRAVFTPRVRCSRTAPLPLKLNTTQWFDSINALGANIDILTAKHGCGFLLWPTAATLPDGSRLALFLVADGHGGAAVAVHLREQLLPAVAAGCADGTPASVEGALRAAFASLHAECQSSRFAQSGATATVVAVNVETGAITAANVGDSQALLLEENEPSKVEVLTVMHRWDRTEERERATMAGADVGQVSACVARAPRRAQILGGGGARKIPTGSPR